MKDRHLILVLGMHRSGTSVVCKSLQSLGVGLGENLMKSHPRFNPKGFFEDLDFVKLNDALLRPMKWSSALAVRGNCEDSSAFEESALAFLERKAAAAPLFALKDPRASILLPFWQPIFKKLELKVSYIIVNRNPLNVAQSLAERDNLSRDKSLLLWLHHQAASLFYTRGESSLVVNYDNILSSPEIEIRRIARLINANVLESPLSEFRETFLEAELNHYKYTERDLKDCCPALISRLYGVLNDLAHDRNPPVAETYLDYLYESWLEQTPCSAYIHGIDSELDSIKGELRKKISESSATLKQLVQTQVELSAVKKQLQESLARTSRLERELSQCSSTLHQVLSSRSWRMTSALRGIALKFRKVFG